MTNLGKNLKTLREMNKLSQRDVAKYLEVSAPSYFKYENEQTEPNVKALVKLADLHNVSLDELVGREFTSNGKVLDKFLMKEEMKKEVKQIVSESLKDIESDIEEKIRKKFNL